MLFASAIRRLLLLLLAVALWAVPAASAADPVINLFSSRAQLRADGLLVVTETITATVPGGGHGMYRDIPYLVRLADGRTVAETPEILSVKMDGNVLSTSDVERRDGGFFRVYMRDRSQTMQAGQHVFSLRYGMRNMVGFFDDHDELNWNVTGALWSVPIERAVFRLVLPEGAKIAKTAAWLGPDGSRDSPVSRQRKRNGDRAVAVFESQRAVQPGEGMTCAVSWQKGIVEPPAIVPDEPPAEDPPAEDAGSDDVAVDAPSAPYAPSVIERLSDWLDYQLSWLPPGLLSTTLLAGLVWGYFIVVWRRYGKDPAKDAIIALFEAPPAPPSARLPAGTPMSPAAVNYLMNRSRLESRGLAAALMSLSGRGACTFSGDKETGFAATAADGTSPYPEEMSVKNDLTRTGPLLLDKTSGERLAGLRGTVVGRLDKDYAGLWHFNTGWTAGGVALVLFGLVLCLTGLFGWPGDWPEAVMLFSILMVMMAIGLAILIPAWLGVFRRKVPLFKGLLAGLMLAMFPAAAGFGLVLTLPDFLDLVPTSTMLALAAALLAPLPFLSIMKAPSRRGRRLMDGCEGLALYIRTAETDRFRHLNPPDRTPELYTRLLPYAVALNLEKAWGENCAKAIEAARLSVEHEASGIDEMLTASLATAIVASTEQSIRVYEASQSSAFDSRDSGGGGGSGSGGGGGGGGFC